MKPEELLARQYQIANSLSFLPRKMLSLHGSQDDSTVFVLHELCNEHCFNFNKAAYFVDNPDFNCLKGVAGLSRTEAMIIDSNDIWEKPELFSQHMQQASFNQRVRNLNNCSIKKGKEPESEVAGKIATDLGMKNFNWCSWDSKYNNHGLFIFEPINYSEPIAQDCLLNGLSLLSFCPIH